MHGLVCRTNSTYFFRITHAEEEGLAESQYEWSTPQERPGCDLLVKRTSAIMVHGIWKKEIPRTSRTIAKVTNILKELANTTYTN